MLGLSSMAAVVPAISVGPADADAVPISLDALALSGSSSPSPDAQHESRSPSDDGVSLSSSVAAAASAAAGTSSPSSRPQAERRSTDPPPSTLSSLRRTKPGVKERPRNTSPFYRGHLRSQSAVLGSHNSLPMTRTQSLPLERTALPFSFSPAPYSPARPSSPLRPGSSSSSSRHSHSPRRSIDEGYAFSGSAFSDIEIIAEDFELDLTPRPTHSSSTAPLTMHSNTFPRSNSGRRRPSSPLIQQAVFSAASEHQAQQQAPPSPSANLGKFDEPFPGRLSFSSSSTPTTPTSFRSRSPSISSLETIPDTPDVVEEEAEREALGIAQLKAAADAADADSDNERKSGARFGSFSRDKKKRWSVCGAERRADFEMETIWED